ncbi:MAG: hypothetical protein JXR97_14895 [Planctomycetes bacterium]|nr:hypothetical protein [Planctomycetota bacterium]
MIQRTMFFSLSLIPAFLIALYLDDDFPVLARGRTLPQTIWLFLFMAKWAVLLGAVSYLLCYFLIHNPFTVRRHIALLLVTAFIGWVGPVTLFDVVWLGGPMGIPMSVFPCLYDDMWPLFALCAFAFYAFYCLAFLVFPAKPKWGVSIANQACVDE